MIGDLSAGPGTAPVHGPCPGPDPVALRSPGPLIGSGQDQGDGMKGFRTLAAMAAAGLFLIALPASAQTFTDADRARVEARIAQLDAIVSSGDLAGALEVVPPVLFRTIAERGGATEAQLLAAMREMIRTQLVGMSVVSHDMDLVAASPLVTPDGSQTYLMIPTVLVIDVPTAGRVRISTRTLAIADGGDWYLIRVEEPQQVALVRELWPSFAGVEFPPGVTEALD